MGLPIVGALKILAPILPWAIKKIAGGGGGNTPADSGERSPWNSGEFTGDWQRQVDAMNGLPPVPYRDGYDPIGGSIDTAGGKSKMDAFFDGLWSKEGLGTAAELGGSLFRELRGPQTLNQNQTVTTTRGEPNIIDIFSQLGVTGDQKAALQAQLAPLFFDQLKAIASRQNAGNAGRQFGEENDLAKAIGRL